MSIMRLSAFRIQNLRSIRDTGWQTLSSDNIACLIGQNESGKSSILEGLRCFDTNIVTSDDLRSDGSMPVIACSFDISFADLKRVVAMKHPQIPDAAWSEFKNAYKGRVNIQRSWVAGKNQEGVLALEEEGMVSALLLAGVIAEAKDIVEESEKEEEENEEVKGKAKAVFALNFMRKVEAGEISFNDLNASSSSKIEETVAAVIALKTD